MIDLANYRSLEEQYFTLKSEIEKFSPELAKRDFAIALTRMDAVDNLDTLVGEFLQILGLKGSKFFKQTMLEFDNKKPFFVLPISAATNENIKELKFNLLELLKKEL